MIQTYPFLIPFVSLPFFGSKSDKNCMVRVSLGLKKQMQRKKLMILNPRGCLTKMKVLLLKQINTGF